jgi:hypothetical protein
VTGEEVTQEQLGGAATHTAKSGGLGRWGGDQPWPAGNLLLLLEGATRRRCMPAGRHRMALSATCASPPLTPHTHTHTPRNPQAWPTARLTTSWRRWKGRGSC